MAISEDTAALVAAQLTLAWASSTNPAKQARGAEQSILATYEFFKTQVGQRPTGVSQQPLAGV